MRSSFHPFFQGWGSENPHKDGLQSGFLNMTTTVTVESSRALAATLLAPGSTFGRYVPSRHLCSLIRDGILDEAQGDGVRSALAYFLGGGGRPFVFADGPGVGKGRQLAGAIDEYNIVAAKGRARAVFFTCSRHLHSSFREDLAAVAGNEIRSFPNDLEEFPSGPIPYGDGVLLVTYQHIMRARTSQARVEAIAAWASAAPAPAMLVFDECHWAQNVDRSSTGIWIAHLQRLLPGAFRIFSSATPASSGASMAYLDVPEVFRPAGADDAPPPSPAVLDALAAGLKAQGRYVSRTLSWDGVRLDSTEVRMTDEMRATFDSSSSAWRKIVDLANATLPPDDAKTRRKIERLCRQHFYGLSLAAKTDFCVAEAASLASRGFHVVVGMLTTGVAALKRARDRSSDCSVFRGFMQQALHLLPATAGEASKLAKLAVEQARVPCANPFDALIRRLGGPDEVAEMSGRTDVAEQRSLFMSGAKRIAIVTTAASTGVSLHQCPGCGSEGRPRVMIVMEMAHPLIPDVKTLVQLFGRVHRKNQVENPRFVVPTLKDLPIDMLALHSVRERLGAMSRAVWSSPTVPGPLSLVMPGRAVSAGELRRAYFLALETKSPGAPRALGETATCVVPLAEAEAVGREMRALLGALGEDPADSCDLGEVAVKTVASADIDEGTCKLWTIEDSRGVESRILTGAFLAAAARRFEPRDTVHFAVDGVDRFGIRVERA